MEEPNETETLSIYDRLAEPFNASCVEWLPKKILEPRGGVDQQGRGIGKALALCYIDARSVMARLDEVVTPGGWRDSYRVEGNRTICRLEIRIGDQWIAKEDASGDSAVEAEKGGVSGAFKRAAVKWGIGRYLYDVDEVWGECRVTVRGEGQRKKVYHNGWTDKALEEMALALNVAPGARETGKPLGVEKTLELIANAQTLSDLQKVYDKHWEAIPLDYRAEVLRGLNSRKEDLNNQGEPTGDENE